MKVVVCLDEKKGMMFNNRRQSRDRILVDDLENTVRGNALFIVPYSETLLLKNSIQYVVSDTPLDAAGEDDYCFIENLPLSPYVQKISEIVIYHWNRHYPADIFFDVDMSAYSLISTYEFAGSSHEKITKEVWRVL